VEKRINFKSSKKSICLDDDDDDDEDDDDDDDNDNDNDGNKVLSLSLLLLLLLILGIFRRRRLLLLSFQNSPDNLDIVCYILLRCEIQKHRTLVHTVVDDKNKLDSTYKIEKVRQEQVFKIRLHLAESSMYLIKICRKLRMLYYIVE